MKYHTAALMLSGDALDAARQPFQDFDALIDLRKAIMHLKPGDTRGRKLAAILAQRGIAFRAEPDTRIAWLDQVSTPAVAASACAAAHRIMLAVLAMTPEQDPAAADPLWGLKANLRNSNRFRP
jgi:hypothetical protein